MTTPAYPLSLPLPLIDGYSVQPAPGVVSTAMDDGLDRVRRRTTARPPNQVSAKWVLSQVQFEVFDGWMTEYGYDWFTTGLAGPSGLESVQARIVGSYTAGPAGGSIANWQVSATLKVRSFTGLTAEHLELLAEYTADDLAAATSTLAAWTGGSMTPEYYP